MIMTQSQLDIEQLRAETPGCKHVLHLNNAGAALMPKPVIEAMQEQLQLEATIGGYEAARRAQQKMNATYDAIAQLINVNTQDIALLSSATNAWEQAFYAMPFRKGDRILTCISEYASNYIAYLQLAQKIGVHIDVIPNDESGQISLTALENLIDDRVKLIAITHVPTNGGLVNPAEAVGKISRKAGIPYLLDACQSVGQMPIDVQKIGCDFLSATSRKYLRGPRGAGFLYVSPQYINTLEPAMLDLHSARLVRKNVDAPLTYELCPNAKRFESWERSYINHIGMGVAVQYALSLSLEKTWERIQILATQLRQELQTIPGLKVQDLGQQQCGLISFTMSDTHSSGGSGKTAEYIAAALEKQNINVSWSSLEYTFLDMEARGLQQGVVRASVHYYNTEQEIERFCQALKTL